MKYLLKACLFVTVTIFGASVFAQDYSDPLEGYEIVVESVQDLSESYKVRRKDFGALFSVNYEQYFPADHVSVIQNKSYEEISGGEPIPVFGAEIGVKYNFALGSIAGLFGYSAGSFSKEENNLDDVTLTITKVDLNFALDNLTSEPWVVPYAQGGIHQIDWEENSYTGSENVFETLITTPSFHYKVGVLLQLNWIENWIDPSTTYEGRRTSGLENTYLDIFYAGYSAYAEPDPLVGALGSDDGEANLSSAGMGLGLKLEF
jgi:hypothetical protein